MAQIVLIDDGTLNILINDLGDVIAAHEDDVELSGLGYAAMKVISITNVSLSQLMEIYNNLQPEIRMAYKPIARPGKWTFTVIEPPDLDEIKKVWLGTDGNWYFLEDKLKYTINATLTEQDIIYLANPDILAEEKLIQIEDGLDEKIHLKSVNLVEAKDLK